MAASRLLKSIVLAVVALTAALALSAAAMIALLAIADPFGGPPHPTDAVMLAQFERVRPSLEEIVGMIAQDPGVERLAPDFTRPEPAPIGPERLADYRARLQAAGTAHCLSRYGDTVAFLVSTGPGHQRQRQELRPCRGRRSRRHGDRRRSRCGRHRAGRQGRAAAAAHRRGLVAAARPALTGSPVSP